MINILLILCASFVFAESSSMTAKNIEGQKNLFEKGWYVITSPIEAWDFAVLNSEKSGEAYRKALAQIKPDKETTADRIESAKKTLKDLNVVADESSKTLTDQSKKLRKSSFEMTSDSFKKSWKVLNRGYIGYAKTNQEDLESLKKISTEFFGRVKTDFKTMEEGMKPILGHLLEKDSVSWKKHFKEGQYSFTDQYEKSGTRGNSLTGLWDILVGYASWTFKAIFVPSAKTAYQGTKSIPYYTVDVILKTFMASSNVVYSLGANIYYTSKLGYKVISPSLEAGYLSSLALLGVINGTVTSEFFRTAGIINKIAIKGSAPVIAGTQLSIEEFSSRAQYAATYVVDGTEAVGEVLLEKVETGVVLGYSALSQLPPQLLLTALNSTIFLVYDGPRIFLGKVTGKIGDKPVAEIPVGTVLDVKKLKEQGLELETLSTDPEVLKKVLQHVE